MGSSKLQLKLALCFIHGKIVKVSSRFMCAESSYVEFSRPGEVFTYLQTIFQCSMSYFDMSCHNLISMDYWQRALNLKYFVIYSLAMSDILMCKVAFSLFSTISQSAYSTLVCVLNSHSKFHRVVISIIGNSQTMRK